MLLKIKKYIDSKEKQVVGLTGKLIEIPTIDPPGINYEKIVSFLEKECRRIGLSTRRYEIPGKVLRRHGIKGGSRRICLLADWNTGSKKTVHINGHYDVVPAAGKWRTNPFKAVCRGKKIIGRGAEDMKGQLAANLLAVEAVKSLGINPRVNVQLSFTPDEEIGGLTGFGWLVKNKLVGPDFGIGEGYSGNYLSCGNKGLLWAEVTISGKSCHGSRPYIGINSFEKMLKVADALKALEKKVSKRATKCGVKLPKDRFATMVLGGELSGGSKLNIVPDKSSFTIDRRILPEEDLQKVKKEILDTIDRVKRKDAELKVRVSIRTMDSAVASNEKEPVCLAAGRAVRSIMGRPAKFALMPGGTDMRFLMKKGIPCVGYSARGGDSWHGDNEFVYIFGLLDYAKVMALTITSL